MSSNFARKVVAITGAGSGIGRATALLLASRGATLSISDVRQTQLSSVLDEIKQTGGKAIGQTVDVRDRSGVESWIETTVKSLGKLDGVANVAGTTGSDLGVADIADIDDKDWDFTFDVNVKGLIHCLRAQVPNMNDGGSIVNVASLSGVLGYPRHYAYNSSKHAVLGITKCAGKELAPRRIRVNAVNPGPIDTPMVRAAEAVKGEYSLDLIPMRRKGTPEEVAETIAFFLCDGSTYITATSLNTDGGWLN